jgi:hypothetical protein
MGRVLETNAPSLKLPPAPTQACDRTLKRLRAALKTVAELVSEDVVYASVDDKAMLVSSAVTFGSMYSRPMIDYLRDNPISQAMGPGHPTTLKAEVEACRNAGLDILTWAANKVFIAMAGPTAESKFTARPIDEVVNSYECENDLRDAMRDCLLAGMTTDEATNVCDNALNLTARIFAERDIWHAVVTLADRLPANGRLEGHRAASIILEALRSKQTPRDTRLSAKGLANESRIQW